MVWTTADFAVVRVEPSKKFAAHCQEKAKAIFDNVVMPELVAKYYTNMKNKSSAEQPPVPDPPQKRPLSLSPQKPTSPATSTGKISTRGRKKRRGLCGVFAVDLKILMTWLPLTTQTAKFSGFI